MNRKSKKRNLSDERINSLNKNFGVKVNLKDLSHMIDKANNIIDLGGAKSWMECAAAERISMEPRRQSCDEKEQIKHLRKIFPDVITTKRNKVFIVDGKIEEDSDIIPPNAYDIDAFNQKDDWSIAFTLKGGQDMDGGHQNHQFDNMLGILEHAPRISSSSKVILVVYVDGIFWTKSRTKYRHWEDKCEQPFSLVDILKKQATGKKCVIWSDDNIPNDKLSLRQLQAFYG